jgi:hypothetical protein
MNASVKRVSQDMYNLLVKNKKRELRQVRKHKDMEVCRDLTVVVAGMSRSSVQQLRRPVYQGRCRSNDQNIQM